MFLPPWRQGAFPQVRNGRGTGSCCCLGTFLSPFLRISAWEGTSIWNLLCFKPQKSLIYLFIYLCVYFSLGVSIPTADKFSRVGNPWGKISTDLLQESVILYLENNGILEYTDLEGTCKDHWVQLLITNYEVPFILTPGFTLPALNPEQGLLYQETRWKIVSSSCPPKTWVNRGLLLCWLCKLSQSFASALGWEHIIS